MSQELSQNILSDQNFGMGINNQDFMLPFYGYYNSNYFRPWKWMMQNKTDYSSQITEDKDNFKVKLDVQHFAPNEINVKVNDSEIIIEGKHEEKKDDHGFISRQFTRKYLLPKDCDADNVTSNLSSDGILTIIARKKLEKIKQAERIVSIEFMNGISSVDFNNCQNKSEYTKKEECKDKCMKMESTTLNDKCLKSEATLNSQNCVKDVKAAQNTTEIKESIKTAKVEEQSELAERIIASKNKIDELLKSTAEPTASVKKDDAILKSLLNTEAISKNGAMTMKDIKGQMDKTSSAMEMNITSDKFAKSTIMESLNISKSSEKKDTITSSTMLSSSMETSFENSSEFISESVSAELKEAAEIM